MAVSLALNWSPPPSSPLFEDRAVASDNKQSAESEVSAVANTQVNAHNTPSSWTPERGSSSETITRTTVAPEPSSSRSPPPQSQLEKPPNQQSSIRSSGATQHHPQTSRGNNMFGSQFQHPQPFGQSTPGYYPQVPPQQNQYAWAQYQQMLQAQAQHFYSQAGAQTDPSINVEGRRRTSSVPQRPPHLTYNDTFRQQQAYPGASFGNAPQVPPVPQMRAYTNPPASVNGYAGPQIGPMQPQGSISASSSTSSAGGFHPYRRTQRGGSDVGASNNSVQFGQGIPPQGQMPPLSLPGVPRARTDSANSVGSARESSPVLSPERRKGNSSPVTGPSSYSASSGSVRNQQAVGSQAGLSHLRSGPPRSSSQSSFSSEVSIKTASRSEATARSDGSAHHSRSDSSSSLSGKQVSSAGTSRMAPAGIAKKPSPLSQQRAQDDDDSGAVYGGSDDEDGRSTPTPGLKGDKAKKTGLSGKLRKALSFSNMSEAQSGDSSRTPSNGVYARAPTPGVGRGDYHVGGGHPNSSGDTNGSTGSTRSTSPPRTPENGANPLPHSSAASISSRRSTRPPLSSSNEAQGKRSIFNRKFNSSTDNISISSTVSSASVMLRKVGNLGKIARRHSLMGLTNMFNKDKEREGQHGHGTPSDDTSVGAQSKGKKGKGSKKGSPATASITHATVELESGQRAENGMTPAASYVRQHQIQMQQQAEMEARAARERAEAEARAKAKAKTAEDATEHRQKMIEKEKERLKNKRGWRKKLGVGNSSGSLTSDAPTGLETTYIDPNEDEQVSPYYQASEASIVSANPPQIGIAYEEGFDASFDNDELLPPHMPVAGAEDSGDEFETDSLRHWGEGIERSRASAAQCKQPKSILKNSSSFDFEKPFAGRVRANSYDAPPPSGSSSASGLPLMSQMSNITAGTDRMDGVHRSESPQPSIKAGSRSGDDTPSARTPRSASPAPGVHGGGVLGHHPNSSMPTLSLMMDPSSETHSVPQRSVTGPTQPKKKLIFADEHIYHSTWPAHVYDRRGELATCNRLTPMLAQRIKEELNTYKMEEMAVAASSRIYTHFFV
ncbi:hypothetical protein IE53DRAFT_366807 [Violaceomyces palustris]|uniref:Uncharacterized protein n=1 Tax=Violaceomyces palustris TaxID=1673888 RepID=A0ACD0P438_9BASI|nr:hypothetical protein IE53DRAFT_366807 [Violaceomyces palustris]